MQSIGMKIAVISTLLIIVPSTLTWTGVECPSAAALSETHDWGAFKILGQTIEPGEKSKFNLMPKRSFEGAYLDMPVFVARGTAPGPALCVTAAIHGDEINSVEVARRVFEKISAR